MPSRSVSVTLRPSSATFQARGEAGLHALAVVGGQQQRVVEVGQDPDVDVGVVQHRIEEQAVGVAAVGHRAAALDGIDGRACTQKKRCGESRFGDRFHWYPLVPVNVLSVIIDHNDFTRFRRVN